MVYHSLQVLLFIKLLGVKAETCEDYHNLKVVFIIEGLHKNIVLWKNDGGKKHQKFRSVFFYCLYFHFAAPI